MKFCKKCGQPMNDDSRFCPNCDWDSMPSMSSTSADVSQDGGFFSRRSKKSGAHSTDGHNCRAESVNGRETVRQKPSKQAQWKTVETKTSSPKKSKGQFSLLKLIVIVFILITFVFPVISSVFSAIKEFKTESYNGEDFSFDFSLFDSAVYSDFFKLGAYSDEYDWYENESADLTFYPDDFVYCNPDEFAQENNFIIDEENGRPRNISEGIITYYDAVFKSADGLDSVIFTLSQGNFSETDIEAYVVSKGDADSELYYMDIGGLTYACVDVVSNNSAVKGRDRCHTYCCAMGEGTVFSIEFVINSGTTAQDIADTYFGYY